MCDIYFEYFHSDEIDNGDSFIFTPKQLISDIIWDVGNIFIPFSNGKRYYVYQEIAFKLIDYYESYYPYLTLKIINSQEPNLPSILINKIKSSDKENIIKNTKKIMTDHINKKFCLFN